MTGVVVDVTLERITCVRRGSFPAVATSDIQLLGKQLRAATTPNPASLSIAPAANNTLME